MMLRYSRSFLRPGQSSLGVDGILRVTCAVHKSLRHVSLSTSPPLTSHTSNKSFKFIKNSICNLKFQSFSTSALLSQPVASSLSESNVDEWRMAASMPSLGLLGAVLGLFIALLKESEAKESKITEKSSASPQNHLLEPFDLDHVRRLIEKDSNEKPSFFSRWAQRLRVFLRTLHLGVVFFPLLVILPFAYFSSSAQKVWWRYTRWALEHLGGAWIKLGQWASTRPDLFSKEVTDRLSSLCRDVSPHALYYTEKALHESLPNVKETVFNDLSGTPVASGAIAQVYSAQLKDGRRVAVKVLHPGIEASIKTDLRVMKMGAWFLELLPGMKWLSFSDMLLQFSATMETQVDLRNEAIHLARFQKNFDGDAHVIFPTPLFASKKVLIESWEGGDPLSQHLSSPNVELNHRIAQIGLHSYLKMMLIHNFVHADLHPGNIAVRVNGDTITLVFYDVGLITEATDVDWDHFKQLFKAIITGNGEHGASLMIEFARSNQIKPEERAQFTREMRDLFEPVRGAHLKDVEVGYILRSVMNLVRKYRVQIEGNFATLCVGTAVLEGIGRQLDPDMNLLGEAIPYFEKSPLQDVQKEIFADSSPRRRLELALEWLKSKF